VLVALLAGCGDTASNDDSTNAGTARCEDLCSRVAAPACSDTRGECVAGCLQNLRECPDAYGAWLDCQPTFACDPDGRPTLQDCTSEFEAAARCHEAPPTGRTCGADTRTTPCDVDPAVLCDGSPTLWFAATGSGHAYGGVARVSDELGWSFLLIDGQCRFFAQQSPDTPVRTGTLGPSDVTALADDALLGRWTDTTDGPCDPTFTSTFRFLDDRASFHCMIGTIPTGVSLRLGELYRRGTDVTGDVRYSVSDATGEIWVSGDPTAVAQPWPLASDPATIAVTTAAEETAAPLVASGADADSLRSARAAYHAATDSGGSPLLRVPIVFSAGGTPAYFNLALRDTIPFELDGHIAVDGFF